MILGICGGSGSGKTTLLRRLAHTYAELKPTVFSMDNYYLPIEQQTIDSNGQINFDLPTALNREKLFQDLHRLVNGQEVTHSEYHFNADRGKQVLYTLEPSELIIVEGLFLFEYQEVKDLLDFSLYVHVESHVQLDRRLYRDQETRGYTRENILYQWENHVTPCFEQFIEPHIQNADFVFHNNELADTEYSRLIEVLKSKF